MDGFASALADLTRRMGERCAPVEAWPAKLGAGLYAGIDYLVADRVAAREILADPAQPGVGDKFNAVVLALAQLAEAVAPVPPRPSAETFIAAVGGVTLLAAHQVRMERFDRLHELGPEFHLVTLLPFMDFDEAQHWVAIQARGEP